MFEGTQATLYGLFRGSNEVSIGTLVARCVDLCAYKYPLHEYEMLYSPLGGITMQSGETSFSFGLKHTFIL